MDLLSRILMEESGCWWQCILWWWSNSSRATSQWDQSHHWNCHRDVQQDNSECLTLKVQFDIKKALDDFEFAFMQINPFENHLRTFIICGTNISHRLVFWGIHCDEVLSVPCDCGIEVHQCHCDFVRVGNKVSIVRGVVIHITHQNKVGIAFTSAHQPNLLAALKVHHCKDHSSQQSRD